MAISSFLFFSIPYTINFFFTNKKQSPSNTLLFHDPHPDRNGEGRILPNRADASILVSVRCINVVSSGHVLLGYVVSLMRLSTNTKKKKPLKIHLALPLTVIIATTHCLSCRGDEKRGHVKHLESLNAKGAAATKMKQMKK